MEAKEALNKKSNDESADPLEVVLSYIGDMGRYQKIMFCLMLPFGFSFAFVYFVQMFIAATPQQHWCRVPELQHLDLETRRNLSAPGAIDGGEWDRCRTYNANWSLVLETMTPPPNGTAINNCQHGWEYDLSDIPYHTVVSERGWVCDKSEYATIAQSIYFVGSLVGGLLFGWLADRFGRIPALVGANLVGCVGGIATIYTTSMLDFTFARFLVGMAYDSCFMMIYILVLEYVGARYRTVAANMAIALFFGGGCLSLPWLAYWIADWRMLLWVTSAPMMLVVLMPLVAPESVRWLISRGRITQAVEVFKKFEKVNGNKIPQEVMDDFIVASRQTKKTNESLLELFKSGPLRRVFISMVVVYMCCAVIFDGLVRLSDSLGLDFFITFTLASATEIPSVILLAFILDRWGRRILTVVPTTITGILILIAAFSPRGTPQVTLAILARFFVNMSYTATIQWSTELLPTGMRASGSSLLHVTGFIATFMSPIIVFSERVYKPLPLLILGFLSLLGAGCALLVPETMGRPMPQTIADGEALANNTFCSGQTDVEEKEMKERKEKALMT